jgi:predicted GIY-YIG superfamily endonuclease
VKVISSRKIYLYLWKNRRAVPFTYIIEGKTGYYYCGITKNIVKRLLQHNRNESKSTRGKGPFVTKIIKEVATMKEARILEVKIKKQGVKRYFIRNSQYYNL